MNRAGKANTFLDRRIGEQDETMNQEERDLQRFIRAQKERFRGSGSGKKGSKFNLEGGDDDAGEDTLTHGGKSVNELDFGRHLREDGYGSDEDMLGDEIVDQLHFGGGAAREGNMLGGSTGPNGHKKTREEIYRELIAKSKAYKAERQQQKREDMEEQDRLDGEMDELTKLLSFRQKKKSKKDEMEEMMKRAGVMHGGSDKSVEPTEKLTQKQKRQGLSLDMDDNDDFDSMAKSLLFEAQVQASTARRRRPKGRRGRARKTGGSRGTKACVSARRFPGRRRRRRRWGQPGGRGMMRTLTVAVPWTEGMV